MSNFENWWIKQESCKISCNAYKVVDWEYFIDNFLDGIPKEIAEDIKEKISAVSHNVESELTRFWFWKNDVPRIWWSIVSLYLHDWTNMLQGSWGFIRPNVVVTSAHVLRSIDNKKIRNIWLIVDGSWRIHRPVAVYFDTNNQDIAFILTKWRNENFINIWQDNRDKGYSTVSLWLSDLEPRFISDSFVSISERLNNTQIHMRRAMLIHSDLDGNGILDHIDHVHTHINLKPWDSGGLIIDENINLKWIATLGSLENYGGWYYEPVSVIQEVFLDFVSEMTKIWLEVK